VTPTLPSTRSPSSMVACECYFYPHLAESEGACKYKGVVKCALGCNRSMCSDPSFIFKTIPSSTGRKDGITTDLLVHAFGKPIPTDQQASCIGRYVYIVPLEHQPKYTVEKMLEKPGINLTDVTVEERQVCYSPFLCLLLCTSI
jgi:hypothetical protein